MGPGTRLYLERGLDAELYTCIMLSFSVRLEKANICYPPELEEGTHDIVRDPGIGKQPCIQSTMLPHVEGPLGRQCYILGWNS